MVSAAKPKLATEVDRTIGSRIAALRIAQGRTQTALGSAIGVSFQQVQKYERGLNRIGAARLQVIAEVLGIPVTALLTGPPDGAEPNAETASAFGVVGALELVKAYSAIGDEQMRREIVSLVRAALERNRAASLA